MINLIPTAAKKSLLKEYWLRTTTVWLCTWSVVVLLGVGIMIPTYALVHLQVNAYETTAATALEKNANFESVSKELKQASELAVTITDNQAQTSMSEYLTLLKSYESSAISITQIALTRTGDGVAPIKVSGVAEDRQALAAFRNRLLENTSITSVDLPISNLAKDKQIPFEVMVTITNQDKS